MGRKYFGQNGQARPFSGKEDQRLVLKDQAKHISERKLLHPEEEPSQEKAFQGRGSPRPVWPKQSEAAGKGERQPRTRL